MKKTNKKTVKAAEKTASEIMAKVQDAIPARVSVKVADVIGHQESLCDKARRLAMEKTIKEFNDRENRVANFWKDFLGDSQPIPAKNKDGTYSICGYDWFLQCCAGSPYLIPMSKYKFHFLGNHNVINLTQLGQAIMAMDAKKQSLKIQYPDNWWGNFRAWVAYEIS